MSKITIFLKKAA